MSIPIEHRILNQPDTDLHAELDSPERDLYNNTITLKVYFAAPKKICPLGSYTPILTVGAEKIAKDCLTAVVKPLAAQGATAYRLWRVPARLASQTGWCYPTNSLGVGGGGRIEPTAAWGSVSWDVGEAIVIEPKLRKGWLSAFGGDFKPPTPPRLV